ncbi:antirestriction protein [Paraburkholderia sp. 31.1]|uniref:antirestriction protein n=1 Tax=Paraburkholderia sp. 31.1 TaxID=2615205 RepID=UPI0016564FC8|nr:antirestriction protein [Paraburkholderia sp. 31.1]MBC8722113.1 antirestriction protein [Paraburkholderia sp. 31.1]
MARKKPVGIAAKLVPESGRPRFLPKMLGKFLWPVAENLVYSYAGKLSPEYARGAWNFYELSNGSFYLAPRAPERMTLRIEGNQFDASMSADAAGITISLFVLNRLIWTIHDQGGDYDDLVDRYYALREYACQHDENRLILRAID